MNYKMKNVKIRKIKDKIRQNKKSYKDKIRQNKTYLIEIAVVFECYNSKITAMINCDFFLMKNISY